MSIVALSDKVSACVTGDRVELFVTNFSGKITMLLEPGVVPAGASSIPAAAAATARFFKLQYFKHAPEADRHSCTWFAMFGPTATPLPPSRSLNVCIRLDLGHGLVVWRPHHCVELCCGLICWARCCP